MKSLFVVLLFAFIVSPALSQNKDLKTSVPDSTKKIQLVEAACGKCQLGLAGKGCDLAVRINGKAWYVDGTDIDSHGDAHAKHGFCNAISKAEVQGVMVNNRFKLSYFKLLPEAAIKTDKAKSNRNN